MPLPFYIVDVFAEKQYQGNQLAVLEHRGELSTEHMQAIAREINFAETTFIDIRTLSEQGTNVRIFTPDQELPFAGHPTLGTAFVLRHYLLTGRPDRLVLNLGVGPIPVDVTGDVVWMEQKQPTFGQTYAQNEVAHFLRLDTDDILPDFPIEEASTGILFMIVPVRSRAVLHGISPDSGEFLAFLQKYSRHTGNMRMGCLVFATEPYESAHDLSCRMFYPMNTTVVEDSATGSANGCLLAYLLKHRVLNNNRLRIRVEQGYAIPRPSLLYHDGTLNEKGDYQLRIGGKVQPVAKGEWFV